ncbi:SAM-dependent methyltransferase [Streptomyces sp. TRM43335]|uniref:S-adenosyl-L-methionine-dependent methyltransferase n=1 Tax=Streptomyces taklimakanensis TaxID=2569853 RepID=A0A6G2BJJ1_9ACTN|nr:SAM-dependent methyltransferase [Streptomyces taklimakanensis]
MAALRAKENDRPDRLFEDPYAGRFLAAAGVDPAKWSVGPATGTGFLELVADQVAVRTRFLDESLLDAAGGPCGQVVLLASGMDARPYRLDWPIGTRVFELDFADVLGFKRHALVGSGAVPRCEHVEVAADLREDWPQALREAGFQPDVPTAWLVEGILYGLPQEAADLLLERVTELSAPGSELAGDHIEDSDVLRAARGAISPELVELWRGGPTGDLDTWLEGHGWEATVHDIRVVVGTFGRPTPPAFDPTIEGTGRGWLVTARLGGQES